MNEAEQIAEIKRLMSLPRPAPTNVGDGWIKVALPPVPMFADTSNYQKHIPPGFLICMVERRKEDDKALFPDGRWHLSISHNMAERTGPQNTPGRFPTWEEIKEARYKFVPDNVNMAIMFPPSELYYNRHETCLHLLEVPVGLALDPKKRGGI